MKLTLTAIATGTALLITFAVPALADPIGPSNGQTFESYLNDNGCVLVDKGGYQNIASTTGGGCNPAIVANYSGGFGTRATPGADGILGTPDDGEVTDR